MIRFVVINKDTGEHLAWFFNKQKALKYLGKYEHECLNQDTFCNPNLEIITETVGSDTNEH